ncbi:hypothetical protein ACFQUU_13500 [Herbaspirillum sp. GCM10030257]|uniref:hypothetical protein n=1 Tax=Herbaspirillum sp. GCM10030257 TaxID=3273393 RepID=UPI0036106A04
MPYFYGSEETVDLCTSGRDVELATRLNGQPIQKTTVSSGNTVNFVEEMKAIGFVDEALRKNGIEGAAVAPSGYPAV